MKQRIKYGQLNKLTDAQKELLRHWWTPDVGSVYVEIGHDGEKDVPLLCVMDRSSIKPSPDALPLLSIGQMIQFIQEKKPLLKSISKARFDKWIVNIETATLGYKDELCDALWEATVRVLQN